MARLQPRRILRNVAFFTIAILLYILYSKEEVRHIEPVENVNQLVHKHNHRHRPAEKLFVDEFWVPEKALKEHERDGQPGEGGHPVETSSEDVNKRDEAYRDYGFNQFVSDKISLNRTIPDTRPPACKSSKYERYLLKASVVVIFHNEGWSTLMRTVNSVLNRSPPSMLKEIVLVDDFSDKDHLKNELQSHVAKLNKVRLLRSKERLGLIRARMLGASNARGDVVIVLDSHCEVNQGWLPPLLAPISEDEHVVTCPIIDFIDHDTFQYKPMGSFIRGTFNWRFDYKERELTKEQMNRRKDETEEVWSPVMAGGLFAISRQFFNKLGQYDPGMEVWGGEQYELSFKIWMCGGRMANMPCSRVGHVYRRNVPYSYPKSNAVVINFRRVAEVWMDDYKEWLYERRPELKEVRNYGDISDRLALRKRLKCHSFKWYMQNVLNDTVRQNYEPLRGSGLIRNPNSNLCLDTRGRKPGSEMGLSTCLSYSWSQKFQYSYIYELRNTEDCLDGPNYEAGSKISLYRCHEMQGNQEFHYTEAKTILHKVSGMCVSVGVNGNGPVLDNCNGKPEQIWELNLAKLKS
ncbi:polypeptide N-acetylgalactosaminyltransferase 10-like [Dendronephthya gigantea]|uniref:polypeptide N-acetylgalactosaminyltransferase 10-like n=1 Tax=Dendronephthya gigantea TaxID=151771 RepID=UPI00106BC9FA|nr:polypeptide N-acetylgalactosaminyltransferase 10-like [Dendronephthya gigantea]